MAKLMVRQPAVAGHFYPGDSRELRTQLDELIDTGCEKTDALGAISPHAGYIYSGRVASAVFSRINIPDTVMILAPNHTGFGTPYSIWPDGSWRTPLGDVRVDEELVNKLEAACELIAKDYDAHMQEHSAEVILPFLQYLNPKAKIVVIVIRSNSLEELKRLGRDISDVIEGSRPDTLVVASSDMTHHESERSANKKDNIAIAEIIALNEDGLYKKVHEMDISMCGIYPAVSMLVCSKERGASSAHLAMYETSAAATGDRSSVVGYAGVIVN